MQPVHWINCRTERNSGIDWEKSQTVSHTASMASNRAVREPVLAQCGAGTQTDSAVAKCALVL